MCEIEADGISHGKSHTYKYPGLKRHDPYIVTENGSQIGKSGWCTFNKITLRCKGEQESLHTDGRASIGADFQHKGHSFSFILIFISIYHWDLSRLHSHKIIAIHSNRARFSKLFATTAEKEYIRTVPTEQVLGTGINSHQCICDLNSIPDQGAVLHLSSIGKKRVKHAFLLSRSKLVGADSRDS